MSSRELYPDAHTELNFTTPLELLVATILSAQTTDHGVNMVTPVLFSRYRTAADYASANREDLEKIIKSTGFFRAKTTALIGLGQALCDRFGGEVPNRMRDLVTLPGVGRKTANVVLGNAFGIPGITVDTHFARLSRRFGWTTETDPVKIESEVGRAVPRKEWTMLSHRLIWHGRRVCQAAPAGLRRLRGGRALPVLRRWARSTRRWHAGAGQGGPVLVTRSRTGARCGLTVAGTRSRRAQRMTVPPPLRPSASGGGRHSAVLMLFGEDGRRARPADRPAQPWLRRHAGQPAFPGGAIDAGDDGPVGAALREAAEEALVDPAGVDVISVLPDLYISRSGYRVSPCWRGGVSRCRWRRATG